ncbi:hypothetical protein B0T24DRAFT_349325 [Lasiosphaeria ovina]|uniref:Uncharacterized protein n=1 Tax=Lasiosphaeria ovina TaxID=92902 RepID=A0AAE0K2T1_9PEZI|nr:hypothetical protein B0T24DRAFT_349325 [Lasiosphaeria ovina]
MRCLCRCSTPLILLDERKGAPRSLCSGVGCLCLPLTSVVETDAGWVEMAGSATAVSRGICGDLWVVAGVLQIVLPGPKLVAEASSPPFSKVPGTLVSSPCSAAWAYACRIGAKITSNLYRLPCSPLPSHYSDIIAWVSAFGVVLGATVRAANHP